MQAHEILKKPLLTEKTTEATELNNIYGFAVDRKANKNQIKAAVEELFDVKVLKIRTAVMPGKIKRFGKLTKKGSSWKKAYVQVQEGQKIELYKNI